MKYQLKNNNQGGAFGLAGSLWAIDSKLPVALVVCLGALVIQAYFQRDLPVLASLPMAVLIGLAFAVNLDELIALVLFSAYFLNWQPRLSLDLVLFAALPLLAWFLNRFSRIVLWLGVTLAAGLGTLIFWAAADWALVWDSPLVLAEMIGIAVFGAHLAVFTTHAQEKD